MQRFKRSIEIPFDTINSVTSWEHFEDSIFLLSQTLEKIATTQGFTSISRPLFRGHSDWAWALESTLDRATPGRDTALPEYFQKAFEAIHIIKKSFPLVPSIHSVDNISEFDLILTKENINQYIPALAYLRHHGFPSPLLDWSQSKDVAAFFAFRPPSNSEFVSIYVFVEFLSFGKMINAQKPRITSIGNNLKVHQRHENQKSEYTVCLSRKESVQYFTKSELVLTKNDQAQDITLKFNIPSTERHKVLENLFRKGINDSYIMGPSEDSLVRSLSYKFFP